VSIFALEIMQYFFLQYFFPKILLELYLFLLIFQKNAQCRNSTTKNTLGKYEFIIQNPDLFSPPENATPDASTNFKLSATTHFFLHFNTTFSKTFFRDDFRKKFSKHRQYFCHALMFFTFCYGYVFSYFIFPDVSLN